MLRVVDYKRKFRVELSERIRAVLAIHRKQYFAVRAADKGIFFAQLLAHALKAVYLAVADAVAAVKLERLHSRRIKSHYRETVKAEQTVSGVYYARVVRTARYRFVKARLKIGKGDAACTVAHYRTHISTSSCTIIQHSIGQVLYLAVPPIFFLIPGVQSNPCPLTRDADGSDTRFPFPLAAHPMLFVQARLCAFQLPRTLCK